MGPGQCIYGWLRPLRGFWAGVEVAEGARLPAERQLATALRVSRTTVASAYEVLAEDRKVARRHGSGTYVTGASVPPPAPPREATLMRSL